MVRKKSSQEKLFVANFALATPVFSREVA